MKRSFLHSPHPILSAIMAGQTPDELIAQARNAHCLGAQAVTISLEDLRPEFRHKEALAKIVQAVPLPLLFYFYRNDRWEGRDDASRQSLLIAAAEAGAAMIDVMGDLFDPQPGELTRDAEAIRQQKALIQALQARGAEVVLSSHMPETALSTAETLAHLCELQTRGAEMVKIVTAVRNEAELVEAVQTTMTLRRELGAPFIHLSVGPFSRPHRFLCGALGTAVVFAVERYDARYAMPQPTLSEMKPIFEHLHWQLSDYLP